MCSLRPVLVNELFIGWVRGIDDQALVFFYLHCSCPDFLFGLVLKHVDLLLARRHNERLIAIDVVVHFVHVPHKELGRCAVQEYQGITRTRSIWILPHGPETGSPAGFKFAVMSE